MGSAQSYISPEAALTAIVVASAVGFGYTRIRRNSNSTQRISASALPAVKREKKQSTSQSGAIAESPSTPRVALLPVVPSVRVIPGGFDPIPVTSPPENVQPSKPKKPKKKKAKPKATTVSMVASSAAYNSDSSEGQSKVKQQPPPSSSPQPTKPLQESIDADGSWTRVELRRQITRDLSAKEPSSPSAELTNSDAVVTTSVTGYSSPVAERTEDEAQFRNPRDSGENRRTLAEKLPSKPRKTGVDDILETPDYPEMLRVMRVQPFPGEKPASGFSWGDYEDVHVAKTGGGGNDADEEDDGWGVVKSKSRSKIDRDTSGQPQERKAPDTLTKRQRQNAKKREAQKASKAETEAGRLASLARHKRELEHMKMMKQFSSKATEGKSPSGGMKAMVDDRGKLVWD